MVQDTWYETVGQDHLKNFILEILKERRDGTVNIERILSEYRNTTKWQRESTSDSYLERQKKKLKEVTLTCILSYEEAFTIGKTYKISAYQVLGKYDRLRIRDDKRQRRDFNFIPTSKNYIWNYFQLKEAD